MYCCPIDAYPRALRVQRSVLPKANRLPKTAEERMYSGIPSFTLMEKGWSNPSVQNVAMETLSNIIALLRGYCNYYGLPESYLVLSILGSNFGVDVAGAIEPTMECLLRNVMKGGGGNVRTQYLCHNTFLDKAGCNVLWWVVIGEHLGDPRVMKVIHDANMSIAGIRARAKYIESLVGYPMDVVVQSCDEPMSQGCYIYKNLGRDNDLMNACNTVLMRDEGAVVFSKILTPPTRIKHKQDKWIETDDAEPPLAPMEIEFLMSRLGEIPAVLPWKIGMGTISPNPDNFLNIIERTARQKFFAGPSGTASGILQLVNMFNGYEYGGEKWYKVLVGIVCCIVGSRHHSISEVMVASEAYGVRYDTTSSPDDMMRVILYRAGIS